MAYPLRNAMNKPGELLVIPVATAVPAGASQNYIVDLPPGLWNIRVLILQTSATTAPTFTPTLFYDAAQSIVSGGTYWVADNTSTVTASHTGVLGTNQGVLLQMLPYNLNTAPHGVHLPYGFRLAVVKNGMTAMTITVIATRLG